MPRPKKNPCFITITCQTCGNVTQVAWQKRNKQRFCSKTCAANNPEVKEKNRRGVAKTFLEKYGGHAMTVDSTKQNFKNSMMKKYGKPAALQVKVLHDRAKKTNMERYGVESVLQKESEIRKQIVDGWISKYGVDNPGKSDEIISRRSKVKKENHFLELSEIFEKENLEWNVSAKDYNGYHFSKKYQFRCKKCSNTFESNVYVPNNVYCELCHPERKETAEQSLLNFLVNELDGKTINRHDRSILRGKELDFYIPELNLAIEYNGLYWHREGPKVSKNYHLEKTNKCNEMGIRLIHIFETEWLHSQNIVKSILRQSLGGPVVKIHGRDCEIKKVDGPTKKLFLDQCHIQGNDKSSIAYGLYYKESLVSLMTFCRSRFDKKVEWEISRFCNALNTKVHGGASKLFSIFIEDHDPKSVVSYSDRRYFSGEVYKSLGMDFIGNTAQGYHYISPDYKTLFNRQMFQKKKLANKLERFDENLSEWGNMKMNGFSRIWDCGHSKWGWFKKI
jgi:hypothetical protein